MKVLLTCIAVALLGSCVESTRPKRKKMSVAESFNQANITRDLDIIAPELLLDASYGDEKIDLGNDIYPGDTTETLNINFPTEPDSYYTFILLDPDVLSAANPYWRSYVLALYVNVGASKRRSRLDLQTGCDVAPIFAVNPVPGTGEHRYILLLFKQPRLFDTTDRKLLALGKNRYNFAVADFIEEYDLGCAVAGNYFISQFPTKKPARWFIEK